MGSFTSAPKMVNDDVQDDDVDFEGITTVEDMLQRCRKELAALPIRIERNFPRDRPAGSIRLLQWNILSQSLGEHNDNFVRCPLEALDWRTRRYRIVEEIVEYNPDIICLQEVDHYQFLSRALRTQGYEGIYFPKPDSPCIYIKGNNGPDGCAIFYRANDYELIKVETRIVEVWRVQSNQVVILTMLRHKASGREICVATTHLKARQGALLSTLRNEQGKDILDFLQNNVDVADCPIIMAGDFNAEPNEPVYSTIRSDTRFGFDSAYRCDVDGAEEAGQEPPYTTWKVRGEGESCHTIDYVFFSRRQLGVNQVLPFPTGEQIGPDRVPSFQYPSDHFSLVVDFDLLPSASQANGVLNKLLCV
ncbi:nocturnin-like isoform X2 [Daphnia pulex]|nr:nocturnin-like isoform X2 [Daphnia pulex]XP_046447619.1 nocturnin-like isoform X2 [Daphnia pulex]